MSAKNGKRSRRRTHDDDPDFKAPDTVRDIPRPDELKTRNKTIVIEEELKGFPPNEIPAVVVSPPSNPTVTESTNGNNLPPQSSSTSKIVETDIKITQSFVKITPVKVQTPVKSKPEKETEKLASSSSDLSESPVEKIAHQSPKSTKKNGTDTTEVTNNGNNEEATVAAAAVAKDEAELMEPLIVDSEEPELQFEESSDVDSRKSSPVLTLRCTTRRSQTRNIPTPKTPRQTQGTPVITEEKVLEEIVEESSNANLETTSSSEVIEQQLQSQQSQQTQQTQQTQQSQQAQQAQQALQQQEQLEEEEETKLLPDENGDTSLDSNFSTKVIVGSDVTRNVDLTLPEIEAEESSLGVEEACEVVDGSGSYTLDREGSLGDTMRNLSSRRTIRPVSDYRRYLLQSKLDRFDRGDYGQGQGDGVVLTKMESYKTTTTSAGGGEGSFKRRRTHSLTPEYTKRARIDPSSSSSSPYSSNWLNYLSTPFTSIKNRWTSSRGSINLRHQPPSSTPKLRSYYKSTGVLLEPPPPFVDTAADTDSSVNNDNVDCVDSNGEEYDSVRVGDGGGNQQGDDDLEDYSCMEIPLGEDVAAMTTGAGSSNKKFCAIM